MRNRKSPLGWMDLPGEIKNRIYELTLVSKAPVYICSQYFRPAKLQLRLFRDYNSHDRDSHEVETYGPSHLHRISPNLLLANKQTYREGCPILYGRNNLAFHHQDTFNMFMMRLDGIRPCGFTLPLLFVQHITLSPEAEVDYEHLMLFRKLNGWSIFSKSCQNLKTITLDERCFSWPHLDAIMFIKFGGFELIVKHQGEHKAIEIIDNMKVSLRTAGRMYRRPWRGVPERTRIVDMLRRSWEREVVKSMKYILELEQLFPKLQL
ncbi:hypothetical protein UCDDS831_g09203 [Diplodia seriata]|uniref:Uncharacterized protein n=1 Tax=Diplodia seriata TaxID=420778 RepID=A0A0G2FMP8_9PEZI|nr:hypothetical protein UCDDS831_g09203 [Diplodia seriata]